MFALLVLPSVCYAATGNQEANMGGKEKKITIFFNIGCHLARDGIGVLSEPRCS